MSQVPVIDYTPLFTSDSFSSPGYLTTMSAIYSAFTTWGIFILTGTHAIQPSLTNSLRASLNEFFSIPEQQKELLHLKKGGWA
jgi:isopenicillin N synthase-like dioxygenase